MKGPADYFMKDNPNLMPVTNLSNDDQMIVMWAYNKKYINLIKFEDNYYYDFVNLDTAFMWQKKDESWKNATEDKS